MPPFLPHALETLEHAARRSGLSLGEWARRADVRAETLSRLFKRDDCDLATLQRLAETLGQRLVLVEAPTREMPGEWGRETERRVATLCASGSTDVARWLQAGPRYFMSGVAMMLASARGFDREAYLALAHALCPAMKEPAEFARWLEKSPARPSRFLPTVRSLRPRRAGKRG